MANITHSTEVSSIIPTIIAAQTLGRLRSNMVLAGIVNRDYDDEIASLGNVVSIGSRGALTANAKSVNTVVTLQTPSTTNQSVTLNQHFEVSFAAEDLAIMFARPNFVEGYATDAAIALLEKIEDTIAALYSGFSQSIDATLGLLEDDFREAQRLLNAAKAPLSNRYAVLHEDAYKEAAAIEQLINRDYQGDSGLPAVQNGMLGRYAGFDVLLNQNIKVATAEAKNLFFQRNAIVLASRPMRQTQRRNVEQVVMEENGIALRVTMSYNENHLAEQMTIDALWGVAELRDNHGVVVRSTEV